MNFGIPYTVAGWFVRVAGGIVAIEVSHAMGGRFGDAARVGALIVGAILVALVGLATDRFVRARRRVLGRSSVS